MDALGDGPLLALALHGHVADVDLDLGEVELPVVSEVVAELMLESPAGRQKEEDRTEETCSKPDIVQTEIFVITTEETVGHLHFSAYSAGVTTAGLTSKLAVSSSSI